MKRRRVLVMALKERRAAGFGKFPVLVNEFQPRMAFPKVH
jgi:hypothetical protein